MIRGKKNFLKNVKLELAIGFLENVISGPKQVVRKKTSNYVIIYPGSKSREDISSEVVKVLEKGTEYEVSVDDVVKFDKRKGTKYVFGRSYRCRHTKNEAFNEKERAARSQLVVALLNASASAHTSLLD